MLSSPEAKTYKKRYNPDVLSCLANLSSDEVFTPPQLANQMLDLLPASLWRDPDARFLDPATKSGVFLREIAKRLMIGLSSAIPDAQERRDHIFTRQLYGLAITELTALMSRRSIYCSKRANGRYSVVGTFRDEDGNIHYERVEHSWQKGRCVYCGASESEYRRDPSLETHAYSFIHMDNPEEVLGMKFDVIIGNPPYQLSDGGFGRSASPIYDKFVRQAKKLNPRYLTMIIPSRWFAGGKGLDDFRREMLNDERIRKLIDYPDSTECFPGVDLSGGICYFLWDRDNRGDCEISTIVEGKKSTMTRPLLEQGKDTFVRYNEAIPILHKVFEHKEDSFSRLVSARKPFGLSTDFKDYHKKPAEGDVRIYGYKWQGYIGRAAIERNEDWIDKYKVFISMAYGERVAKSYWVLGKPFLGEPGSCCTETYLVVGPFANENEGRNAISYMITRFFRFLVLQNKPTQHATSKVYAFAPVQDFSEPWTDEKLYAKYGITEDEIAFIESMIRPMELDGDDE